MAFDLRKLLGLKTPQQAPPQQQRLPQAQPAPQGLNVSGQGLQLESMPGLNGVQQQPQQVPLAHALRNSLGARDEQVQDQNQEIQGERGLIPQIEQMPQGGVYNPGLTQFQGSNQVRPIQARQSNWYDY